MDVWNVLEDAPSDAPWHEWMLMNHEEMYVMHTASEHNNQTCRFSLMDQMIHPHKPTQHTHKLSTCFFKVCFRPIKLSSKIPNVIYRTWRKFFPLTQPHFRKIRVPHFTRWWFQIFFHCHPENWGRFPIWLIFFKGVGWKPPTTWRIIPFSKWLITMISKFPKWSYSPSKWPKWLTNRGY